MRLQFWTVSPFFFFFLLDGNESVCRHFWWVSTLSWHYECETLRFRNHSSWISSTAGLRLFARHAPQFSSGLIAHYREVFDAMSKLCGHINHEMKKTSYYALEAFLKQVTLVFIQQTFHCKKFRDRVVWILARRICRFRYSWRKMLRSTRASWSSSCKSSATSLRPWSPPTKNSPSPYEDMDCLQLWVCVSGKKNGNFVGCTNLILSLFKPCKKVCPQDVELMYTELIQRCKQMYLTESDGEDESFYQLPSFLDSVASVLIHLDKVTNSGTHHTPLCLASGPLRFF